MTQPILSFRDVSLQRGQRQILKHIDWTIQPRENWAILGLNGAGKTTMLKIIHGDLWPSEGQMEVLGGIFGHTSIPELTKRIGWVSTALQDWLHPGDLVEKLFSQANLPVLAFMNSLRRRNWNGPKKFSAKWVAPS